MNCPNTSCDGECVFDRPIPRRATTPSGPGTVMDILYLCTTCEHGWLVPPLHLQRTAGATASAADGTVPGRHVRGGPGIDTYPGPESTRRGHPGASAQVATGTDSGSPAYLPSDTDVSRMSRDSEGR